MGYAKWTLIIVGLIVFIMGILGLVPDVTMGTEPEWHAALKIVIGLIAMAVGFMEKGE